METASPRLLGFSAGDFPISPPLLDPSVVQARESMETWTRANPGLPAQFHSDEEASDFILKAYGTEV